jgi:hypothetical protein
MQLADAANKGSSFGDSLVIRSVGNPALPIFWSVFLASV